MEHANILFADNDADFLETRMEFLAPNYHVVAASTPGEAEQYLREHRIHLAILDIRLVDDNDDHDISGLTLAKDDAFRHIPKIMLTGYPGYAFVREALGPALEGLPPAIDFLSKHEGSDALLLAVQRAFTKHIRINWSLMIRWSDGGSATQLAALLAPQADAQRLTVLTAEVDDLLRRLFFESAQITIVQYMIREQGYAVLEVATHDCAGKMDRILLACGNQRHFAREKAKFEAFAPQSSFVGSTKSIGVEKFSHFGAIAYTLTGVSIDETSSFRHFYQNRPINETLSAIDLLFQHTLGAWYEQHREVVQGQSLLDVYGPWLRQYSKEPAAPSMDALIKAICQATVAIGFPYLECGERVLTLRFSDGTVNTYPNPVAWLARVHLDYQTVVGPTHGRVGADAIRVSAEGHSWLIDFRDAGTEAILWDFVSLEASIKLDLLDLIDPLARYQIEADLAGVKTLDGNLDCAGLDYVSMPIELQKALAVTQRIRACASQIVGNAIEPYQLGLLIYALRWIATFDSTIRYTPRELATYGHALLMAAIATDALTHTIQAPEAIRRNIWIDTDTFSVWVENEQKQLTPQDFNIFKYLYEHQNRVVKRREILDQALGETDDGSQREGERLLLERSRLNSAMSRLRRKIEPDPDHPRYITSVRGIGYRLVIDDVPLQE